MVMSGNYTFAFWYSSENFVIYGARYMLQKLLESIDLAKQDKNWPDDYIGQRASFVLHHA